MKVYATDIDGLNEWWSAHRARKEIEMGKTKKMGKGVAALTEVPGALKMDPKNVRRRERAAELREAREEARAEDAAEDARQAERHDTPLRAARIREDADLKAGIDQEYLDALDKLDPPPFERPGVTSVTFYDGMSKHAAERLKEAIDAAAARPRTRTGLGDDPVPVRLSVTALAMFFSEACAKTKEADAALDAALADRLLAKAALDAEVARLANEVG